MRTGALGEVQVPTFVQGPADSCHKVKSLYLPGVSATHMTRADASPPTTNSGTTGTNNLLQSWRLIGRPARDCEKPQLGWGPRSYDVTAFVV